MFDVKPYPKRSMSFFDPFADLGMFERKYSGNVFSTDIKESDSEFVIKADLPGFKKENITLEADGDVLTIKATRKSEYEETDKKNKFIRVERSYGTYERKFDISGIDTPSIKAKYTDGVLCVTLPKKSALPENTKRFEIE